MTALTHPLSRPDLLRDACYLDGKWVGANGGASIPVDNPSTGKTIVSVPKLGRKETEQAIASAQAELANAAAAARSAGGPALAAATEAARIARIGYAQGKFGQLDLLDAERTLADTKAAAVDALVAYHDAEARLARLTTPAPDLGGTTP